MNQPIDDIKKVSGDKIIAGREVLLKYLADIEKKSEPVSRKPAEVKKAPSKMLDSLMPAPVAPAPQKNNSEPARIDFVKDFQQQKTFINKIVEKKNTVINKLEKPPIIIKKEVPRPVAPPSRSEQKKIIKTERKKIAEEKREEKRRAGSASDPSGRNFFERAKLIALKIIDVLITAILRFFAFAVILGCCYFIFCLSLYTFKFDNGLSRFLTKFLPVPAFITDYGYANYYEFVDAKNNALSLMSSRSDAAEKMAEDQARATILKQQILQSLSENYGLVKEDESVNLSADQILKIENAIVLDPEYNRLALKKIRNIKTATNEGGVFSEIAKIENLSVNIEYFTTEEAVNKFGITPELLSSTGQVELVADRQGYYLIKYYTNKDGLTGLEHLYMEAKTLEQVVAEKMKKNKFIILAN